MTSNLKTVRNIFNKKFILEIKNDLKNYCPNSGCLTKEEAKFCNLYYSGPWKSEIFDKYIQEMSIDNREIFVQAKKNFELYNTLLN